MSWRRSTLSGRRITVAIGVVIVAIGLVPVALARTAGRAPSVPVATRVAAGATEAASTTGAAGAAEVASPAPADAATPGASEEATEPAAPATPPPRKRSVTITDEELADARQVAADFAAAYASYRYDEAPEVAAARLEPWSTAELAQQLSANAGGAAARAALAERRQVAEAQVQTVSVQRVNGREIDLLVVVQQKLTWVGGRETQWPSYLTRVVRGPDGWRVAALQP